MGKRAIGEVVDWEDMQVGDEVRFVKYCKGHEHWGYVPGEIYAVEKNYFGDIGPLSSGGVPHENYDNTFVFICHKLANTNTEKDEEEQPVSEFFGKKYRVTPETSKLLQEAVFAAGGSWMGGDTRVECTDRSHIYIYPDGSITHGDDTDHYNDHKLPEGKLEIVQAIKLVEVIDSAKQSKLDKIAKMKKQLAALEAEVSAE